MNKNLVELFKGYGMSIDGNRAYGIVKGYEVSMYMKTFDNVTPFRMHFAFYANDDQKRGIENLMSNIDIRGVKGFTKFGLELGMNDLTVGRLAKRLPAIIDGLLNAISANGALGFGYCPVCGKQTEEGNVKKCRIDGFDVTVETGCVENLNAALAEENEQFKNAPNNRLRGFLGAVIGGIAGGGCVAIFYAIGIFSAISAIVSVVLGAFLYEKFGGKPNKSMLVIVAVTTLVCMYLAVFIAYLVDASLELKEVGISSVSAFEVLKLALQDKQFAQAFYTDMAMVLLFSLLGIGFEIFYLSKKIKRKKNIEQ